MGTRYGGFQVQDNAQTIQGEVEKVMGVFLRQPIELTGSSRTDAGVHALMNCFHFDYPEMLDSEMLYNLNAMLPYDIVLMDLWHVPTQSHCRFDAIGRRYGYHIHNFKDPFAVNRSWYMPYKMDPILLTEAANLLIGKHDFTSFAKRNSQVNNHYCTISECKWEEQGAGWKFSIQGNRFLRGMVRGLVGTMVKIGRGKMTIDEFTTLLQMKDNTMADFTAPAHGLFLEKIEFPVEYIG
jgi:tRNA pseudouridine38-40 synthase